MVVGVAIKYDATEAKVLDLVGCVETVGVWILKDTLLTRREISIVLGRVI